MRFLREQLLVVRVLERYRALEPEVPAARADGERDLAIGLPPALRDGVPDREVVSRERDRDRALRARLQERIVEPAEDRRRFARRRWMVQVQLRDLSWRSFTLTRFKHR